MLIFVQVYRTIDKMLYLYKVLEEQKRAKELTKWKLGAPEVQSALEVITSSEAPHQK